MRINPFLYLILFLTVASLACGLASPVSVSPATVPVRETVLAASLTSGQLKNAQYQLGTSDDHSVVQLTDGKYQHGSDVLTLDYVHVSLTDFLSIGDLTADGVNEAAALVFENYGGSGDFGFLTIYTNVNGLPVFLTSTMIDDRPMINNVAIENDEVYLDAVVHGFDNPGCCPGLSTTRRYSLVNNQLRLEYYTTAASDGSKRIIEITSPIDGTESMGSVQVSGSVSIAPIENNLSYFIYDSVGNQLASGPVTVTAPDFGAPGIFNESISLASIPAGTTIYLEIQDISAADGTLLALDAVKLVVK